MLDSGVRVVTERMDSVRSVALGLWIGTGSAAEDEPEAGLSHLIEHMLFRGTERYGSLEIDQLFDAMGAELNAGTGKETTSVYSRVLDRHLERAFDVMADMVWRPASTAPSSSTSARSSSRRSRCTRTTRRTRSSTCSARPSSAAIRSAARSSAAPTSSAGDAADALRAFHAARYVPAQRRRRGRGLGRPRRARRDGRAAPASSAPAAARRALPAPPNGQPRPAALLHQGHRAVPRLPRRARARPRRRAPLRAARARQRPGRHVVLAAVPGGAREARPGLLRLLLPVALRRHRPDRPVPRHAPGQRGPRAAASSATSSSASAPSRPRPTSSSAPRRTSRAACCSRSSRPPRA